MIVTARIWRENPELQRVCCLIWRDLGTGQDLGPPDLDPSGSCFVNDPFEFNGCPDREKTEGQLCNTICHYLSLPRSMGGYQIYQSTNRWKFVASMTLTDPNCALDVPMKGLMPPNGLVSTLCDPNILALIVVHLSHEDSIRIPSSIQLLASHSNPSIPKFYSHPKISPNPSNIIHIPWKSYGFHPLPYPNFSPIRLMAAPSQGGEGDPERRFAEFWRGKTWGFNHHWYVLMVIYGGLTWLNMI